VLLFLAAWGPTPEVTVRSSLAVVQWTFLLSAAVAFLASRGRHLSWVLFLGIAVASWLGSR